MAKNPKVKDPTEAALSAIQEALNIGDAPASTGRSDPNLHEPPLGSAGLRADDLDAASFGQPAANDDREMIGAILQTIQKGRPRRSANFCWCSASSLA